MPAKINSMFSLNEVPWHGQGVILDTPTDDEGAIVAAGLDWDVKMEPLYTQVRTPIGDDYLTETCEVRSHRAVIRGDSGACLGVVGKDYQPLQNSALFDVIRGLAAGQDLTWETAGALGDGQTVWALARLNSHVFSIAGDEVIPYMLASNGHVGNRAVVVMPTTVRVVCANTLAMADAAAAKEGARALARGWRLNHGKDLKLKLEDMVAAYRGTQLAIASTVEAWTYLAGKPLTDRAWRGIVAQCIEPWSPAKDNDEKTRANRIKLEARRTAELDALRESPTNRTKATAGTMFGALNAVTEWVDHHAGSDAARWGSAALGAGALTKGKAFAAAMAYSGTSE